MDPTYKGLQQDHSGIIKGVHYIATSRIPQQMSGFAA